MADTNYIAHLGGHLREIVVDCYLAGLKHTYRMLRSTFWTNGNTLTDIVVSLGCSLAAAFLGLFIRHHQL